MKIENELVKNENSGKTVLTTTKTRRNDLTIKNVFT